MSTPGDTTKLLREYESLACAERDSWGRTEGDEADYRIKEWQRKIDEIRAAIHKLETT